MSEVIDIIPKKLYRYEDRRYSICVDPELEIYDVTPLELTLIEFTVHSETPCGYWFGIFGGKEQWVSKTSRKRYAYITKKKALKGYIERKKAFVRHSKARLDRAQEGLVLGYAELEKLNNA